MAMECTLVSVKNKGDNTLHIGAMPLASFTRTDESAWLLLPDNVIVVNEGEGDIVTQLISDYGGDDAISNFAKAVYKRHVATNTNGLLDALRTLGVTS